MSLLGDTMDIIGIITTKNRFELLKRALDSAFYQTKPLKYLILVSDSDDDIYEKEYEYTKFLNCILIRNRFAKNYAGSLNTAFYYIIKELYITKLDVLNSLFIALLDDDDYWKKNYIEICSDHIKDRTDIVVSGLLYEKDSETIALSIPLKLHIDDFLKGNPHIQGSNTFLRFKTLLQAGLADESMNSNIDRDMFVRLFMLHPNYEVILQHLVHIDASSLRARITTDHEKKKQGLDKFFRKYQHLMTADIKNTFKDHIFKRFDIVLNEIETKLLNTYNKEIKSSLEYKILVGVIATDYDAVFKLMEELIALDRNHLRIIILVNGFYETNKLKELLLSGKLSFVIITLDEVIINNQKLVYGPFVSDYVIKDKITSIAVAREIIHHHLYHHVHDDEVIWIMDEDVLLKQLVIKDNHITVSNIPIDYMIESFKDKIDIGVGHITGDPAIPTFSTIRTNLIDYMYHDAQNTKSNLVTNQSLDYYYDLSSHTHEFLEQPFPLHGDVKLDDAFSGKSIARPLILLNDEVKDTRTHGGNTLIFNKEVLKIPNLSIKVHQEYARRGDYFWIQLCETNGFKVKQIPFGILHERHKQPFIYEKEISKLKRDVYGSSLTKTYQQIKDIKSLPFFKLYEDVVKTRLTDIIISMVRIQGILSMIDTNCSYLPFFNDDHIEIFTHDIITSLNKNVLEPSLSQIERNMRIYHRLNDQIKEKEIISKQFNTHSLYLLGYGNEANVYSDGIDVYKVFNYNLTNEHILSYDIFKESKILYRISLHHIHDLTIIKYPYEASTPYQGGYFMDFIMMLRDFHKHQLIFSNISARNFIVTDNHQVKLIDYGISFESFTEEKFLRMIERTYHLLHYHHIPILDYKSLINLSYQGLASDFNYHYSLFKKVVFQRYKEMIHDDLILKLINKQKPLKVLDYGAGKCKIANTLSDKTDVSVFDIDVELLKTRAHQNVVIIEDIENVKETFDLINSNLVLCAVDNDAMDYIIQKISTLLDDDGHVVFSMCHPFYNDIDHTELRMGSHVADYEKSEIYIKKNRIYLSLRDEYHRPFKHYVDAFNRNQLYINHVYETFGINLDKGMSIGEHLVCILSKKSKNIITPKHAHLMVFNVETLSMYYIHELIKSINNQSTFESDITLFYSKSLGQKEQDYLKLFMNKGIHHKIHIMLEELEDDLMSENKLVNILTNEIYQNYHYVTYIDNTFIFNHEQALQNILDDIKMYNQCIHHAFQEDDPFGSQKEMYLHRNPISINKSNDVKKCMEEEKKVVPYSTYAFRKLKGVKA